MSDSRDAEAIAAARAALDTALEDFAKAARDRVRRLRAFAAELDREHKRALRALREPLRAFARALDPEELVFERADLVGSRVVDAVLPNWDAGEVKESLGDLGEDMPKGDVSDALDDLRQAEADAAEQYGATEDESAPPDDDE